MNYPERRDLKEVRRENLRRLVSEWGGPSQLAKRLGYANPSYMVQMVGPNPTRDVTEKMATKIEVALNLTPGEMSVARDKSGTSGGTHTEQQSGSSLQTHSRPVTQSVHASTPGIAIPSLTAAIDEVSQACEETGVRLTTAKFADLVTFVFDEIESGAQVDRSRTKKLVRIAQ